MKTIELTRGATTSVDEQDYETLVALGSWHLSDTGYAVRRTVVGDKKMTVRMHRLVASAPEGKVVDHINGDKLDNRRANLRICTQKENTRNQKKHREEQHAGYWYHQQNNNWVVEIYGKHIGCFGSEELANQIATMVYAGELPRKKMKEYDPHCKNEHNLEEVGVYRYPYGEFCKQCASERSAKYYKRKKARS